MATLTETGIQIERLNDIVKRFEDGLSKSMVRILTYHQTRQTVKWWGF